MDTAGRKYKCEKLKKGFQAEHLDSDCTVVFSAGKELVENTALKMLKKVFEKAGIPVCVSEKYSGGKAIILGTAETNSYISDKCADKTLSIGDVSKEDDGFEIKKAGDIIYIAGANGRGVLYGVYDFEEYLLGGAEGELDRKVVPAIRKRSDALGYYWNKYQGMIQDDIYEEKVEYLSRLRVNQYHACQDGNYGPHFQNLVKSDMFPYMNDPNPDYVRKTKKLSRLMHEYGIDYFQWVIEPVLPALGSSDITKFPEGLFGKHTPPDWYTYRPEGIENTMCVNSPLVQEYYLEISGKFALEYPDIKGIFMYNNDCQAWFCEPDECEKCREAAIDPVGNRELLWENEMRIQSIVNEGIHRVRPDMESLFWPTVHFSGEDIRKLLENTTGYTALNTGWDGQDHDAMVPDCYTEPNFALNLCKEYAEKKNVPLYIYFSPNRNECLPQGFPYPHIMGKAIKKFYSWGIRNLVEVTGPCPTCNGINAIVMKALETDPGRDIDDILDEVNEKQFGKEAGEIMHEAFNEIKEGMEAWNECSIYPYRGSSNHFGLGPIMHYPPSINPDYPDPFIPYLRGAVYNYPMLYKDGKTAEKVTFIELFQKNSDHFAKAAELAKKAVEAASDDEFIFYAYYNEDPEGIDIPTKKQYAEMNASTIEIASLFCKEKVDKLKAARLLFDMEKADAEEKARLTREYVKLVKADIPLQVQILGMIERFKGMSPQLTRVGITEIQVDKMMIRQKEKIAELYEYLNKYDK